MKKYGFFILAGLLALSLGIMAACRGEEKQESEDGTDGGQTTEEENGDKIVGDTVEIGTAEGLRLWADKVGWVDDFSGITLKLTADIDLSGETWTPVDSEYRNLDGFVFDGQGHTISGLRAEKASSSSTNAEKNDPAADDAGFFGWVTGCSMEIRNVTFSGADVKGRFSVGTVIGCFANGSLTLENVTVQGSTVTGKKWFGGVLGCVEGSGGTITAKNVSVRDSAVTEYAASDLAIRVGGLVGYTSNIAYDIQGGAVSGNTFTAYHSVACVLGSVQVSSVSSVSVTGMTISGNKVQGHASLNYLHEVLNTDDWNYAERDAFKEGNTLSDNIVELI